MNYLDVSVVKCGKSTCNQRQKTSDSDAQSSGAEYASPVAEHNTIPTEQDQLEMMENVAYGPLKCTTTK